MEAKDGLWRRIVKILILLSCGVRENSLECHGQSSGKMNHRRNQCRGMSRNKKPNSDYYVLILCLITTSLENSGMVEKVEEKRWKGVKWINPIKMEDLKDSSHPGLLAGRDLIITSINTEICNAWEIHVPGFGCILFEGVDEYFRCPHRAINDTQAFKWYIQYVCFHTEVS